MNYYIKNSRAQKINSICTPEKSIKSEDFSSCMICTRSVKELSQGNLFSKFCSKCIAKQICGACILEITSSPCPFCHTNNKVWRSSKRKVIVGEIDRRVAQKKRFWESLEINKKNIHLQYAIKSGIQEFIQSLDTVIEKMSDDVKYLVKIDFDQDLEQSEEQVKQEIEQINSHEENYDCMMIQLKSQFNIQSNQ